MSFAVVAMIVAVSACGQNKKAQAAEENTEATEVVEESACEGCTECADSACTACADSTCADCPAAKAE